MMISKNSFLYRTRLHKDELTETEDEIIEFISRNKSQVTESKIVSLAEQFFTVPNTITRLCHKLGYSGFSELKYQLKNELNLEDKETDQIDMLERNTQLIDERQFQKISDVLYKSDEVICYAQDQTRLVAEIGLESFRVLDGKFQILKYQMEMKSRIEKSRNTLFFFISFSGETADVIELAFKAKQFGHKVISLTNLSDNTLSKISDYALYCETESIVINNFKVFNKIPMLIILQSLFYYYMCKFTLLEHKTD